MICINHRHQTTRCGHVGIHPQFDLPAFLQEIFGRRSNVPAVEVSVLLFCARATEGRCPAGLLRTNVLDRLGPLRSARVEGSDGKDANLEVHYVRHPSGPSKKVRTAMSRRICAAGSA